MMGRYFDLVAAVCLYDLLYLRYRNFIMLVDF